MAVIYFVWIVYRQFVLAVKELLKRNERLRAIVYFLSHERGKFRLKKGIQDTF